MEELVEVAQERGRRNGDRGGACGFPLVEPPRQLVEGLAGEGGDVRLGGPATETTEQMSDRSRRRWVIHTVHGHGAVDQVEGTPHDTIGISHGGFTASGSPAPDGR